jgi:hypothetical protein
MFLIFLTPIVLAQEFDFQLNQNNPSGLPLNQNSRLNPVFDEDISTNADQDSDQTMGGISVDANDVPRIIGKLAKYLYNAVLIISTIFILISAFYFLKGGDNPAYLKKARSQLVYAVIGIAIAILSFGVEQIINSFIRVGQGG